MEALLGRGTRKRVPPPVDALPAPPRLIVLLRRLRWASLLAPPRALAVTPSSGAR